MSAPDVSVLMTVYNSALYLRDAIESVLASTYTGYEFIIVDDCSTDESFSIASEYAEKNDCIRLFKNEINFGDYNNRNIAASYARGRYIKYLDSDDTIYPWGLQAMLYCMDKFPEAAFGVLAHEEDEKQAYPIMKSGKEGYHAYFFHNRYFDMGPSASIIKREAFESVGGFSGANYFGDVELWLRLSQEYNFLCLPHDLFWWRRHEGQQSLEEKSDSDYDKAKLEMYKKMLSQNCPLSFPDRKIAIQNQKSIRCRQIIKMASKGKFSQAHRLWQYWQLSASDLLRSLLPNKIPGSL